jgi:glyoxylase-like metal-dependent hydrolase (beta-lactamase superfamily II)
MSLTVTGLTVGPLAENCWVLADHASRRAVVVDPGDEAARILSAVRATGCDLHAIWLTHAHFDHIGAVAGIRREMELPVLLHPADLPLWEYAGASALRWGIPFEQPTGVTEPLAEGGELVLGSHRFRVLHLPGHAPGHVAFVSDTLCVSGDVLFAGSIGRTDLPLSDPQAMQQSLARLAALPPALRVLTGHGPDTTIGAECASNPFLTGGARPL